MMKRDFDNVIDTLLSTKDIKVNIEKTGGRPQRLYEIEVAKDRSISLGK